MTEANLKYNLARLDNARRELAIAEAAVRIDLRLLANERKVAFIRIEQAQREFGL